MNVLCGTSNSNDPKIAVDEFYNEIMQENITFAVFFCSSEFDLEQLSFELKEKFGDIPLVGCTTAGSISKKGFEDQSLSGVSVASADFHVESTLVNDISTFTAQQAKELTSSLKSRISQRESIDDAKLFSFLLIDGLSIAEENFVGLVSNEMNDVPLFGGSAGDGLKFEKTYVYFGGEFSTDAAVLSLIRCEYPFRVFKTEHYIPTEKKMVITRADPLKRIVYEIDGSPAAQEYAELVGLKGTELTPLTFSAHPVVVKIGGQHFVRSIQKVNDDGSLTFYCAIDEGLVLTIAEGTDIAKNLEDAFESVKSEIGEFELVLGCDCILRRLEIEENKIADHIGSIMIENKVVGFSTYGEQYNAMHANQTFIAVAIGKKR